MLPVLPGIKEEAAAAAAAGTPKVPKSERDTHTEEREILRYTLRMVSTPVSGNT